MTITLYRLYSSFAGVPDTISIVRPTSSDAIYTEANYYLPDGYTLDGNTYGDICLYDADGNHCDLCLSSLSSNVVVAVTGKKIVALRKAPDEETPVPLQTARLQAQLTQQQLADASGVNIRQIRRVEIGEALAGNMTASNLLAIADALGIDPHKLV